MKKCSLLLLAAALYACSDRHQTDTTHQSDSATTAVTYEQVAAESAAVMDQLRQAAAAINQRCPIQVDASTRLDSAHAASSTELQYFYTLTDIDRAAVDVAKLEANLRPLLVQAIKTNPALADMREHSIIMTYQYRDQTGQPVIRLAIGPADYGE